MTMSSGVLLESNFQQVTGKISFCRHIAIEDLCCNTIINTIYLQTFCSSQRAKMYGYMLQTTQTQYYQRDTPPCSQNQNEQKQVIKDSCGEMWQWFQRGKHIGDYNKRMMHFCKNTLEPNERTSVILLHFSGKSKAVTFAFLLHKSTDIPKA